MTWYASAPWCWGTTMAWTPARCLLVRQYEADRWALGDRTAAAMLDTHYLQLPYLAPPGTQQQLF